MIAEEVNYIETAYLRVVLSATGNTARASRPVPPVCGLTSGDLPQAARYAGSPNGDRGIQGAPRRNLGTSGGRYAPSRVSSRRGQVLLPALNNMIDVATTRTIALQMHPPESFMPSCSGWVLICSLLAGYRMSTGQHRSWLHILGFTVITVILV